MRLSQRLSRLSQTLGKSRGQDMRDRLSHPVLYTGGKVSVSRRRIIAKQPIERLPSTNQGIPPALSVDHLPKARRILSCRLPSRTSEELSASLPGFPPIGFYESARTVDRHGDKAAHCELAEMQLCPGCPQSWGEGSELSKASCFGRFAAFRHDNKQKMLNLSRADGRVRNGERANRPCSALQRASWRKGGAFLAGV